MSAVTLRLSTRQVRDWRNPRAGSTTRTSQKLDKFVFVEHDISHNYMRKLVTVSVVVQERLGGSAKRFQFVVESQQKEARFTEK